MFWADQVDDRRICLLGMEGSLSSQDLAKLAERLRGLAAQGASRVVVDLRPVSHWDFRGLRCLAEAVAYRRSLGAVTAFITPSRYLREIAVAAGVDSEFDFYDALRLERREIRDQRHSIPREEIESPGWRRASGL